MPKVKFIATESMKGFRHKVAGVVKGSYGGKATTKIQGPQILKDGDVVEVDDFELAWYLAHYPDNFKKVEPRKPKTDSEE